MTDMKTSDSWVAHDQGRIFCRQWLPDAAAGVPIVLFHDSLGSVEVWRDFPAALCSATRRAVVAYDRLGFGRSDALRGLPPLDFVRAEAQQFFPTVQRELGLDRFVALGHSVGGGMAIEVASARPTGCTALVTIAAQVFPEERTLAGIREAARAFEDPAQVARLRKWHGDKAEWVLRAWIERWLDPAFASWTLEPTLATVRCDVLALHGSEDEYGSRIHPDLIGRRSLGASRVEMLQGLGHVPHREQPARVVDLISEFLRDRG